MEMLYGALGALATLLVLSAGICIGWMLHGRHAKPKAPPVEEQELRRMAAEQNAFRELMHYSADTAYGIGNPLQKEGDG